ncbi:MAG: hypothetical protein K2L86_09180 [Lachnospiraceae bacterium]|nr:hypothetical protein [Lachnospiraceae bacterium]
MMTNKERYQQAFSALPSSRQFHLEVEEMAQIQKKHKKNMAIAAAVTCAVLFGAGGTAYAADLGGIQTKVSIWLNGKQVEAIETPNENGHGVTFTIDGEDGTESVGYGGICIDEEGNETWMNGDELVAQINESASVKEDEDGRIWAYYYDQKTEITDLFDENGVCTITMTHEDKTIQLEITDNGGGGYSIMQTNISEEAEAASTSAKITTTTSILTTDD